MDKDIVAALLTIAKYNRDHSGEDGVMATYKRFYNRLETIEEERRKSYKQHLEDIGAGAQV